MRCPGSTARASTATRSARPTRTARPSRSRDTCEWSARSGWAPPLPSEVGPGDAVAIPTGGMLPAGADAVVMIEHTAEATADTIEVVRPVAPGENVVRFDEDVAAGRAARAARAPAARAGRGAARRGRRRRGRRPRRAARDDPRHRRRGRAAGHARARAGAGARRAERLGRRARRARPAASRRRRAIVPDDDGALRDALTAAVGASDVVVICAGSSVGMRDQTAGAVAALPSAETWCHGLAIKPGQADAARAAATASRSSACPATRARRSSCSA